MSRSRKPRKAPVGKNSAAAADESLAARLRRVPRRSWIAAFAVAVVFWAGVLALLTWSGRLESRGKNDRVLAFRSKMLLREVEIALEAYKEKFGAYPECANPDRGAEVLFDRLMAGSAPDGSDRFLMPSPDRLRKEPGPDGEIRMSLVDPFGHPIRYRTGAPPGEGVGPHPDYSLWSTGGKPDNPPAKWITL